MLRTFLLSSLSVLILFSCSSESDQTREPQRPYQPWIMRSVLDGMPRMVTLALNENLYVAYNTGTCGIRTAWKGHVDYEGAVFTTAHGPQPVIIGDYYLLDSTQTPWQVFQGESLVPAVVRYAGHRVRDGHAELMYQVTPEGKPHVMVYEMIEYAEGESGQIGLARDFYTENLPEGYQVRLNTMISSIVSQRNLETNGTLNIRSETPRALGTLQILDVDAQLALNPKGQTHFVTWFAGRPTIKNPHGIAEQEDVSLPLGQRLIERNDCKTCHNPKLRTIGPAYVEVAQRYANNEETVTQLVNKVITGGGGIWGAQVMSPHPTLSRTDCAEIVRYILSLDAEEQQQEAGAGADTANTLTPVVEVNEESLVPGALTTVYTYSRALNEMPAMQGKPAMAGVMPNFDNIEGAEFVDLTENFAIHAKGFILIPEPGVYTFQLWSDDGSVFKFNNEVVIDHGGIHGTTAKEHAVSLARGLYPFEIRYFQGDGGKFLSLDWRRPGGGEYEVIPATLFFHHVDDRAVLSGMTLPMSSLSKVPGDRFPLVDMHPSYDLFQARPHDFLPKVGGMDVMSDGTLVVCTWDPTGSVYLIRQPDSGDPADIKVKKIASGLAEPLGLKVVDDEIYVLQKQELTKLVDVNGDEMIDEYRVVSNQWQTSGNFHEFAFGLAYRDGYFYANLAIAILPGGASANPQIPDRGKTMKISREDGSIEFIAHGLRTPNGIGWGVDDELFVADNQGDWLPSSKILHVTKGAWFGSRAVDYEGTANLTMKPPVVWLPQDEIGNSPSQPGLLKDGPYAGQMFHGEVTHGGLKRVFVEKVNGEYQGAVFRFIQGLEAGINRIAEGPDGSIYVGGIGNPGNWAQAGKLWYGLQRVKYNGKPTFEMLAVRAKTDGIEIEFTEPLQEGDGWDPLMYEVRQWRYVPTENYGGPKVDDAPLPVSAAHVSADHQRVFLAITGIKPGYVVYLHLKDRPVSAAGRQLWSTEAWYTMNQIPANTPGDRSQQPAPRVFNALTAEEAAAGWQLLFDGKSLAGWHNFNKSTIGKSWVIEDHAITLQTEKDASGHSGAPDGGDILTDSEYENFELRLDWKISNCGNSGIIYNVTESEKYEYPWQTGPEMQVLDNACHPDARNLSHRAGDLFDLVESAYMTAKPAGEWNSIRLIKQNGHVEHWLNGVKVLECEMYTDRWQEMIASSKFRDMADFGKAKQGKIALQDHGDKVWFRNIRIRPL